MSRTYRYHTLLLAISLLLSACHTQTSVTGPREGETVVTPPSTATTSTLFSRMADTYAPWTDLYVPITLRLEAPKSMSVSGRATMVNGKEILISLRMLGMELAVIYINESKIYAVDKIHKQYIEEDLSRLLSGTDITISDVQNILLGRVTNFGKGTITEADADDFTFLAADSKWILTPVHQIKGAELHYIASRTDPPALNEISLRVPGKGVLECAYSGLTDTPAGTVASLITMLAPIDKKEVRASVEWNLGDAKWNEARSVNFKAPSSSYKRIDVSTLLKSIDKM